MFTVYHIPVLHMPSVSFFFSLFPYPLVFRTGSCEASRLFTWINDLPHLFYIKLFHPPISHPLPLDPSKLRTTSWQPLVSFLSDFGIASAVMLLISWCLLVLYVCCTPSIFCTYHPFPNPLFLLYCTLLTWLPQALGSFSELFATYLLFIHLLYKRLSTHIPSKPFLSFSFCISS